MPVEQVDKALVRRRFCRSLQTYEKHASVQREAAERLGNALLSVVGPGADLGRVLELGCGTGVLTRELLSRFSLQQWRGNDIACVFASLVDEVRAAGVRDAGFFHADMETHSFTPGWDLVAANACFQWLRDPVQFISGLPQLLVPDGLLAFSSFGADNMAEIAALTGKGLHYVGQDQIVAALSTHCEVLVVEDYHRCMRFASPYDVLRHIKATGTNAVSRSHWSRKDLESFSDRYRERFGTADGGVRLTYHPMLFVARIKGAVNDSVRECH